MLRVYGTLFTHIHTVLELYSREERSPSGQQPGGGAPRVGFSPTRAGVCASQQFASNAYIHETVPELVSVVILRIS